MGLFGKSKDDTSQDEQIKQLWKWIETLNKNQDILIKNNSVWIANEKNQRQLNKELIDNINSLIAKDKQHDAKDTEHDALIQGIKNMAKAVETATTE